MSEKQSQNSPDDSEPTTERQAELLAAYQANIEAGRAPYTEVRILTRGEVSWIIAQHPLWSGEYDDYTVKYTLIPQGIHVDRINLKGAWLADIDLAGMKLRRADLSGTNLVRANLADTELVDADLSNTDLGFSDLSRARLNWADLGGAHLREVSFCNAQMPFANLRGAGLALCDLRGANLRNTRMDAATLLANVDIDCTTLVRDIVWNGASLTSIDWSRVDHLGDEDIGTIHRQQENSLGKQEADLDRYQGAARANQQLSVALREQGITEAASRFAYRAQIFQRKVLLRKSSFVRWFGSLVLDLISGYGYRPGRTLLCYLVTISGFMVGYLLVTHGTPLFGLYEPVSGHPLQWYEALVLSMASFHGRGFFPQGITLSDPVAILAAIEAVIGLFIEIIFIATFTQRFFGR
jgi:Pentapeptide repeats (8 copies)